MSNKVTPFWYLGFISAFALLTFDLYQPALPNIIQYFNTTHDLGQLTLSSFFLVFGLSQLLWGPLIDHYGRRKTLQLSLIIFLFATIACTFSTDIIMLVIGRMAQGFAICCSNVVAFSSARDYEDNTERARVISHISMIVSISPIFAPLVGSLIFMSFGWQATFVFMLVLAVILLAVSQLCLRESPAWQKAESNFNLGISIVNYKNILGNTRLWLNILIITASYSCIMLVIVNATYVIIDDLQYSPFAFSLLFACNGSMLVIGNYAGIKLREKRGLSWNIQMGSSLMVTGSLIMLVLFFSIGVKIASLAPILLISFGVSIINPPTFSLALAEYPKQAGTATAVINTVRMTLASIIGGLVGAAIIYDINLLAISLFLCSLICWFLSLFITESSTEVVQTIEV